MNKRTLPQAAPHDLPPEVISLARALIRRCREPGRYSVEFMVTSHKFRMETAVISRVERLQVLGNGRFGQNKGKS